MLTRLKEWIVRWGCRVLGDDIMVWMCYMRNRIRGRI